MTRDTDLLPCPFCGAEPPDLHLSHITGRIFCEGCGAEGPWSPAFNGDWNTRIPAAPAQEPPSPGVTAGAHEFYLGNVDARVAEMTDVDVWQLCLDGDEFERKGRIGDCLLRREAEAWMDRLGFAHDHVALRMMDFVHAAHKRRSIQAATPAPVVPAEGLPDLTCPGIDAAIEALEAVRAANSQMRYGYWHMQEELAALRSAPPVARVTWIDLGDQMPPKDQPFLARNPGFAAFIAEWSETDQEYLTYEDADGWQAIYFSHWLPIPDLPAALLPAGEGE